MGNSDSQQYNQNMSQSMSTKGLTQEDLLGIQNAFESFNPKNGVIFVKDIQKKYQVIQNYYKFMKQYQQLKESYQKDKLDQLFKNKDSIDYATFYNFLSKYIIEQKQQFGNDIDFDGDQQNQPNEDCFNCLQSVNRNN